MENSSETNNNSRSPLPIEEQFKKIVNVVKSLPKSGK